MKIWPSDENHKNIGRKMNFHITLIVRQMRTRLDLDDIMDAGDGLVLRTRPSPAAIISSKSRLVRILPYNKDY